MILIGPLDKIFTTHTASTLWGVKENTIRVSIVRGRFSSSFEKGWIKKCGNTWIIHEDAMFEVFGQPKNKREVEFKLQVKNS
jgi:hypothetical protein